MQRQQPRSRPFDHYPLPLDRTRPSEIYLVREPTAEPNPRLKMASEVDWPVTRIMMNGANVTEAELKLIGKNATELKELIIENAAGDNILDLFHGQLPDCVELRRCTKIPSPKVKWGQELKVMHPQTLGFFKTDGLLMLDVRGGPREIPIEFWDCVAQLQALQVWTNYIRVAYNVQRFPGDRFDALEKEIALLAVYFVNGGPPLGDKWGDKCKYLHVECQTIQAKEQCAKFLLDVDVQMVTSLRLSYPMHIVEEIAALLKRRAEPLPELRIWGWETSMANQLLAQLERSPIKLDLHLYEDEQVFALPVKLNDIKTLEVYGLDEGSFNALCVRLQNYEGLQQLALHVPGAVTSLPAVPVVTGSIRLRLPTYGHGGEDDVDEDERASLEQLQMTRLQGQIQVFQQFWHGTTASLTWVGDEGEMMAPRSGSGVLVTLKNDVQDHMHIMFSIREEHLLQQLANIVVNNPENAGDVQIAGEGLMRGMFNPGFQMSVYVVEGAARTSGRAPLVRFLRRDGDDAIMRRVLQYLLL